MPTGATIIHKWGGGGAVVVEAGVESPLNDPGFDLRLEKENENEEVR